MKIGILTFWWSEDNYGQLLQCYALQRYLRNAGHDVFLIRYNSTNDYIVKWTRYLKVLNPYRVYMALRNLRKRSLQTKENNKNPRYFSLFRNKYIIQSKEVYNSYTELFANPPCADVYIVGSDQVWNINSNPIDSLPAYFLKFGSNDIKRISYAASFGLRTIDKQYINEIKNMLSRFEYVSVRERSAVALCASFGILNAEVVPDPTILLNAEHYRSLYSDEVKVQDQDEYCFVYILNNSCSISIGHILRWVQKRNIRVIYITGNSVIDDFKKEYPTILEWLSLIDHAKYVITNSFHCSVFSLIFHKQFVSIPLLGKVYEGMNARLESLFSQFGINRNATTEDNLDVLEDMIDWEEIERRLIELRCTKSVKNFLSHVAIMK